MDYAPNVDAVTWFAREVRSRWQEVMSTKPLALRKSEVNRGLLSSFGGGAPTLRSFDEVVDFALAEQVDLVLFAGDAYRTRDPSPTQQREFAALSDKVIAAMTTWINQRHAASIT